MSASATTAGSPPVGAPAWASASPLADTLGRRVAAGELDLPSPPDGAAKVIAATGRDDADLGQVAELVRREPALAAHILRIANSSLFAAPAPIVSLQQAVLDVEGLAPPRRGARLRPGAHVTERFDLVAIGAGPAGQKAAIQASKVGRRALIVEQTAEPGGPASATGPSRARPYARQRSPCPASSAAPAALRDRAARGPHDRGPDPPAAADAAACPRGAVVGRAYFAELARGRIAGAEDGMLKLVADPDGRVLGTQIVGEGAADLVHVAQMAIIGGLRIEVFVDHPMNFPTLAEAYRVAALDILNGERPGVSLTS